MKLFRKPIKGMAKTMLLLGFLLAIGGTSLFAQISSNSLGNLFTGNGTLTIGDKTFSGFGWTSANATLNSDAANLIVTAYSLGGVDYLDFGGMIALDNTFGTGDLLGDLKLSYTVTANPGSINMIDQQYTPNALPASGQIIIGETVANNGIIVANSTLTLSPTDLSDPQPEPGDNLYIVPSVNQLAVVKDITIDAFAGNTVGLSDVQQSFHQVPVPEPGTMLLGSLGGGLLLLLRSRRQVRRS